MLTELEICQKIAKISPPENLSFDTNGYPIIRVLSKEKWVDFNPVINAGQLKVLTKKFLVSSKFEGAGVTSRAHTHKDDVLIAGESVFNGSYEKSILLAVIKLFETPELKDVL